MNESIALEVARETGCEPASVRLSPVGGGDSARAFRAEGGAETLFVKLMEPGSGVLEAEADGLTALAGVGALRVPRVRGCGQLHDCDWLVLEWLDLEPTGYRQEALGRGLAELHRAETGSARFGWHRDNFIGPTPQANPRYGDWPTFFREARLKPQLEAARQGGLAGPASRDLEMLMDKLEQLFPEPVQPSLVHGDLWQGNVAGCGGEPVLYDPAVYHGHHEVDLAMLELFGGPGPDFWQAYEAVLPLSSLYPLRRELYNLYHLLNHFRLFGGGYGASAGRSARRLLEELR